MQITGLTASDKCTWLIRADTGAPGFLVLPGSNVATADVDIHYLEYTDQEVLQYPATSATSADYRKYFLDGTSTLNSVKGNHYDQTALLGGELPQFYIIDNPSDPSYAWKKRFVVGNVVGE